MKLTVLENLNPELVTWNDRIYQEHPTPYQGIAGAIEKARLRSALKFARCQSTDAILEVGCERGILLSSLPDVRRIVGADISNKALEDAQKRFQEQNRDAEFYQLDGQLPLPFTYGEFDVIICSEMLEHVHNPRAVIENIHRIANNKTRVVLTVPIEAPKVFIKTVLKNIGLFQFFFPGIEEEQSEGHLQSFSELMLRAMIDDLFQIKSSQKILGIHYIVLLEKI